MSRTFLSPLLAASLLIASADAATTTRGSLVYDGIPDRPLASAETLDAYLSARQAAPLGFTPKGQLLIVTRFGETDQLHLVDHPLGERRQITFLREPITQAAFSPDTNRNAFFYQRDTGGDGNAQLYYQHLGDPAARRLTDGKSMNGAVVEFRARNRVLHHRARRHLIGHRHRRSGVRHAAASRGDGRRSGLVSPGLVGR
jgi:hypothetical protein